ncbi:hypothetical protein [Nocardia sienata]|uniref:hypothetical protein n=1 Tax=Nocardia sienata TaxID=248552 RepID=UPI000AE3234C|nr:hypothetical protein [Nocardia sienata]
MRGLRRFAVVSVLLALAALLPACGADRDPDVVRIGVNDLALTHWEVYREKAPPRSSH